MVDRGSGRISYVDGERVAAYLQTGTESKKIAGRPESRTTSWLQRKKYLDASTVMG
jgi:hypothetical protein